MFKSEGQYVHQEGVSRNYGQRRKKHRIKVLGKSQQISLLGYMTGKKGT